MSLLITPKYIYVNYIFFYIQLYLLFLLVSHVNGKSNLQCHACDYLSLQQFCKVLGSAVKDVRSSCTFGLSKMLSELTTGFSCLGVHLDLKTRAVQTAI